MGSFGVLGGVFGRFDRLFAAGDSLARLAWPQTKELQPKLFDPLSPKILHPQNYSRPTRKLKRTVVSTAVLASLYQNPPLLNPKVRAIRAFTALSLDPTMKLPFQDLNLPLRPSRCQSTFAHSH